MQRIKWNTCGDCSCLGPCCQHNRICLWMWHRCAQLALSNTIVPELNDLMWLFYNRHNYHQRMIFVTWLFCPRVMSEGSFFVVPVICSSLMGEYLKFTQECLRSLFGDVAAGLKINWKCGLSMTTTFLKMSFSNVDLSTFHTSVEVSKNISSWYRDHLHLHHHHVLINQQPAWLVPNHPDVVNLDLIRVAHMANDCYYVLKEFPLVTGFFLCSSILPGLRSMVTMVQLC